MMVRSKADSVESYLAELPHDRRAVFETVLELVRRTMPAGFREEIGYGGICWSIPLEEYPDTYNGQPLCYVALASQKNHNALYLMSVYGDLEQEAALRRGFEQAGKRLDMGRSCVRFRRVDDLALDAVKAAIGAMTPEMYITRYEATRAKTGPKATKKRKS